MCVLQVCVLLICMYVVGGGGDGNGGDGGQARKAGCRGGIIFHPMPIELSADTLHQCLV